MTQPAASAGWPVHDLRLRYGDLLLRPLREHDLPAVVALMPDDVEVDPALPADRGLAVHQGYWRALGSWTPQAWVLSFLVHQGNLPVGVQTLEGTEFPLLRTVDTASWLVRSARGLGVGKAMRTAVLGLAFGPLAAQAAVTSAWHDNAASLGVSRALGYQPNGEHLHPRDGRADVMVHLRLTRERWAGADVVVEGLEPCRGLFGA